MFQHKYFTNKRVAPLSSNVDTSDSTKTSTVQEEIEEMDALKLDSLLTRTINIREASLLNFVDSPRILKFGLSLQHNSLFYQYCCTSFDTGVLKTNSLCVVKGVVPFSVDDIISKLVAMGIEFDGISNNAVTSSTIPPDQDTRAHSQSKRLQLEEDRAQQPKQQRSSNSETANTGETKKQSKSPPSTRYLFTIYYHYSHNNRNIGSSIS